MEWIKARLKERSTYIGLSLVIGASGVTVQPEMLEPIGAGVMALIGLIETGRSEG